MLGFKSHLILCHSWDNTWGVVQRVEPTEALRCPEGLVTPLTAGLIGQIWLFTEALPFLTGVPLSPSMRGRQLSP